MLLDRSSVIAALQIRCDMLAADFDSTIRRFESSRPSQAVWHLSKLAEKRGNSPEIRAIRVFDTVSGLPICRTWGENRRKSPARCPNIPVLERQSAETGSIGTA